MQKAIETALKTWYSPDHSLHNNPHHPLGKLLGEWGELLDDYMKGMYKVGYVFEPEDELGDIWYYLRVLCYQKDHEPACLFGPHDKRSTDLIIATAIYELSCAFVDLHSRGKWSVFVLDYVYSSLLAICERHNLTLEQLTRSNWEKLKPGSVRGDEWMRARD